MHEFHLGRRSLRGVRNVRLPPRQADCCELDESRPTEPWLLRARASRALKATRTA
jgi:hypothetical protein